MLAQKLRLGIAVSLGVAGLGAWAATPEDPPTASVPRDTDAVNTAPMPAEEAAKAFRVPEGFHVSVFAAEPAVRNPIALAFDAKGRLWVAENDTYAEREARFDLSLRDRVVIFEDTDNDGRHDARKVFTEDVQRLTSVEVGRGGVWLMCPPALLFLPDRDGDDRPDGPAVTVLDGFTVPPENYHNFANGLRWGPDGWLYGRCGASSPGDVGAPGTPDDRRIPLRGGLWRYHPERKVFESLNSGTTNPWGHDWNAVGEPFFINTVNGHLWHAITGAHFVRPHTVDPNPYVYELIDQHADHWHWDNAKDWTDSRNVSGEHDRRGGGHAHSGMTIYAGDNWPDAWRGKLLTLNLHGRRANVERLERAGSGYVGKHEPDTLFAADANFRGIDLAYGPDGGVYVLDWSDTGECHESNGVQRSSGRIYKVTYGGTIPKTLFDLSNAGDGGLVGQLAHRNQWWARTARRVLADRAVDGKSGDAVALPLRGLFQTHPDPIVKLRALWALYAIGKADEAFLRAQLAHPHESVRTWAVRLLTDARGLDTVDSRRPGPDAEWPSDLGAAFDRMAREDASGLVRLALASALQRMPISARPALARALASRSEDAGDHNLPLLVWYGLIPVAEADPKALEPIALEAEWPTLRRLVARRLTERLASDPKAIDGLVAGLAGRPEPVAADVLAGFAEGLRGWRKAPEPSGWDALAGRLATAESSALQTRARELGVVFGDGRALDEVRAVALDGKADLAARRAALESLIEARPDDLRAVCEKLLNVRFLNTTAARGLALFDDPAIAAKLAGSYKNFHPSERPAVLAALVQRPAFAKALLDAVASGKVPRTDVSAFHARQIASLNDPSLSARLAEVWGEVRSTASERQAEIVAWKQKLTPQALEAADLGRGRGVYNQVCATCHRLYGQGREVGPDLTGAGRDNIDYLVENIFDPGATVSADFRMTVVALADGRVLNGIVKARTDRALTLQTQEQLVTLPRSEIEEEQLSPQSLMPDALLQPLSEDQVRDLIGYLRHRTQVALPAGAPEAPADPVATAVEEGR